jgi:hypothetical protein
VTDKNDYWFPAKVYGWGWGLPIAWQGWLVYAVAAVLLVAGHFIFPPTAHPALFFVYLWSVLLLLVVVCWVKGERPHWRWGK